MEITELTNQTFCYWLQGYFEISQARHLNAQRLMKISQQLDKISEPLGLYTTWLKQTVVMLQENNFCENLVNYFTPMITSELNHIFQHDIDNSYDTPHSAEYLLKIHRGEAVPQESND
ncbi:MAG TPA: hypothetical protein VHZ76_01075 [Gammaproteobacteria bacterium]|nr:hypothetical protein [Gammaproteobacteria bacterium]